MKKFSLLKTTLIGGIFFLIPFGMLIMLGSKAVAVLKKIAGPIAEILPFPSFLGFNKAYGLAILLLALICFIAGLIARTKPAKRLVSWLEDSVLSLVPGYTFMKKSSENMAGFNDQQSFDVVLARIEGAWQLAFLIERIDENNSAVYVPGAPSPWSGSLYFMTNDTIKDVDITYKEALNCIKNLGSGSAKYLEGKI
jgi:uncharacterized membrane protein